MAAGCDVTRDLPIEVDVSATLAIAQRQGLCNMLHVEVHHRSAKGGMCNNCWIARVGVGCIDVCERPVGGRPAEMRCQSLVRNGNNYSEKFPEPMRAGSALASCVGRRKRRSPIRNGLIAILSLPHGTLKKMNAARKCTSGRMGLSRMSVPCLVASRRALCLGLQLYRHAQHMWLLRFGLQGVTGGIFTSESVA